MFLKEIPIPDYICPECLDLEKDRHHENCKFYKPSLIDTKDPQGNKKEIKGNETKYYPEGYQGSLGVQGNTGVQGNLAGYQGSI